MAERTEFETEPQPGPQIEQAAVDTTLPENQFNNVVRMINGGRLECAKQLAAGLAEELVRLGAKQNGRKAVSGLPEGSDNADVASVFVWARKVQPENTEAVAQIVALHATAHRRVGG